MERFRIEQLTFQYPGRDEPALRELDLAVQAGEFLVIFGPSGCGKTTLLRHFKPELVPHGLRQGRILLDGEPLLEFETAGRVGFVLQDPEDGIVCDKVWHELVFGLENLGMDQAQMRTRAAETAAFFGMEDWFYRDVKTLSGGQKQILCLASAMILQPEVLVLDEPTSRLDPVAAEEFLGALQKVHRELGTTIILSEHRLEGVLPLADRVLGMDKGRIVSEGGPRQVEQHLRETGSLLHRMLPVPMRLYGAVQESALADLSEGPCPVTVREGRDWLFHLIEKMKEAGRPVQPATKRSAEQTDAPASVEIKNLWFRYDRQGKDVLKGLSFTAGQGEICAILGGNGSGKSTLLMNAAGILKPQRGKLWKKGRSALVPQEPVSLFTRQTAGQELEEMLEEGHRPEERKAVLEKTARKWGLEDLLDAHPYDLSGGEQQRLALAKVMLTRPEILLLDEPTKGMDPAVKAEFVRMLKELKTEGVTILVVTHDVDFCGEAADRCGMLFDGVVLSEGTPAAFFREKRFYTTSAGRISRGFLEDVVTYEDLLERLGLSEQDPDSGGKSALPGGAGSPKTGEPDPAELEGKTEYFSAEERERLSGLPYEAEQRRALNRRTALAAGMILLAIPLTIFCGVKFFDDRNYYLISLLIIAETLLPFILIFEKRRPQAREMILLAVMCAIAVLGRSIFFMVPEFKPVVALVIIAGLAFGAESGFLVGAMTGFVSNFFFGQGPWTPWQMFAFGIIGFLAGLLYRRNETFYRSRKQTALLCIFGGLAALLIYGPIMNTCAVVTSIAYDPSRAAFKAVFLSGLPFDLIHAVTTALCLAVLAAPMMEKLRRIKRKYGLL